MSFTLTPAFTSHNSPSKLSFHSSPAQTLNTSRTQKTLTPQYLEQKFQELYLQVLLQIIKNQRWAAKKEKLREQHLAAKDQNQLKQCTFQPTLNPELSFNGSNPSPFLKREEDWVSKKERRIEELARQTQKKLRKQCSFKPKISSKSYAILNHTMSKTSRTFGNQTQRHENNQYNKTFERKKGQGCYREIHMKQQGYKEIQKMNSTYEFKLMTEKRFAKKMGLEDHFQGEQMNLRSSREQKRAYKLGDDEDYIENIVIKAEQQNTFDSLTSLELKTQAKTERNENVMNVQGDEAEEEEINENQEALVNEEDEDENI